MGERCSPYDREWALQCGKRLARTRLSQRSQKYVCLASISKTEWLKYIAHRALWQCLSANACPSAWTHSFNVRWKRTSSFGGSLENSGLSRNVETTATRSLSLASPKMNGCDVL